jgi:methionine sulfoxide reductase heme-binding subunit
MTSAPDLAHHAWWLASRASGIVALAVLSASVVLGLAMAARAIPPRRGLKPRLAAVHEHLALAALFAIAVHAITLLGDAWLRPGLAGIAVPFAMSYRPVFTGLGIVAGYLAALLGLSFYARRRIGPRLWRRAHRLTVVAYLLAVVHTLGAGTDAASWWLRALVLAPAAAGAVLFAARPLRTAPQLRA